MAWPIPWERLEADADAPLKVTLSEVLRDGLPSDDPWADFEAARRVLTKAMRANAEE